MDPTGQAVGDHWNLISALIGVIAGIATTGVTVIVYTARIMDAIDKRVTEKILLSLSNGAGERVREIAHSAVADAMSEHQIKCPVKDRLDSLEEDLRG